MKLCCAAILLLLASCLPAMAQNVDYDALEQMFGEPVTASATGKPQKVSDAPADMEIITADDIEHSGADNIPDVLRFVAGLDVRRYSELDAAVGIRGNNTALNPRVLVLLDGRQVYEDDYGFTSWPLIPVALSEIRQIEIIKGPSAALYGFNAVSGVINIVTYDPLHHKVNAATAEVGTQSQTAGDAVATWQIPNRLGVRLSATGFRSTEFTGSGDNIQTRHPPHVGDLALDVRDRVASNVEWDVSASDGSLDSGYFVDIGLFTPLSDRANSVRSLLSADTGLGLLQLDLYRTRTVWQRPDDGFVQFPRRRDRQGQRSVEARPRSHAAPGRRVSRQLGLVAAYVQRPARLHHGRRFADVELGYPSAAFADQRHPDRRSVAGSHRGAVRRPVARSAVQGRATS